MPSEWNCYDGHVLASMRQQYFTGLQVLTENGKPDS